jgi:hypothetical protein
MTNQTQKIRISKINTLYAIAYANLYPIVYINAYSFGYAKHMFIVYSLIVYLFIFNF